MQIVGYETGRPQTTSLDGRPAVLLVSEDGVVSREELEPGSDVSFPLGERRCAGITDGETHVACESPATPYCDVHSSTWVCARCTGTCLKDEMDCYEEHAVYLAAFAPDTFKVGVTREWRLETRLAEQGADRAAHLYTVSNGRIAREIEADLAQTLTDRVRVPTKIAGLHRRVSNESWRRTLDEFDPLDTFAFAYGFELADRPIRETLASGTVVGTKGRILLLERAGGTYAVDMRDLVGYEVTSGARERNLQASLGTFD